MSIVFRYDALGPFIYKDPQATLDYTADWDKWLGDDDQIVPAGDGIATECRLEGNSGVLVTWGLTAKSLNDTRLTKQTAWVSGGVAGDSANLVFRIETSDGRIEERTIRIIYKDR